MTADGLATAFPWPFAAFTLSFHDWVLPLPFLDLPLHLHCLSLTFHGLATAFRYDMSTYYSFVYGGLKHFDLPDMAAAVLVGSSTARLMVGRPLDAQRRALAQAEAASTYSLAVSRAGGRLALRAGSDAAALTAELLVWLQGRS